MARSLAFGLLAATAGASLDDTVALVQLSEGQQRQRHTRIGASASDSRAASDVSEYRNVCQATPELCREPFNCHMFDAEAYDKTTREFGMSPDGHASLSSWCNAPWYKDYAVACLAMKDLTEAARRQYRATEAGVYGPSTRELDGSYCFIAGHCVNPYVVGNTTLEDAERQCDDRFNNSWREYGKSSSPAKDRRGPPPSDPRNGFDGAWQTRSYLLAACAMGNYHCDVIYCKESYCKIPYYVKKYGHWLKDRGFDDGTYVRRVLSEQPR